MPIFRNFSITDFWVFSDLFCLQKLMTISAFLQISLFSPRVSFSGIFITDFQRLVQNQFPRIQISKFREFRLLNFRGFNSQLFLRVSNQSIFGDLNHWFSGISTPVFGNYAVALEPVRFSGIKITSLRANSKFLPLYSPVLLSGISIPNFWLRCFSNPTPSGGTFGDFKSPFSATKGHIRALVHFETNFGDINYRLSGI